MSRNSLTVATIEGALRTARHAPGPTDRWLSDPSQRGRPVLNVRIKCAGPGHPVLARFYARYTTHPGQRQFLPLGDYAARAELATDTDAKPLTLAQANERMIGLIALYQQGIHDLRDHFERKRRAQEHARHEAAAAEQRAADDAKRGSFGALLKAYLQQLGITPVLLEQITDEVKPGQRHACPAAGATAQPTATPRQSANDALWLFRRHVFLPWPDLVTRRAAELRPSDLRPVLARVVEQGHGRTAAKLRAYLHAAFAAAIRAEHDATAPVALMGFGLELNPVAVLDPMSQFNRAGDRVLSMTELVAYLRRVEAIPSVAVRMAALLCVLLGGQRPAQLLRVKRSDVDLDAGTLRVYDPKGARRQPRLHLLPITPTTRTLLAGLMDLPTVGPYLFSSDGGQTPLRLETLSAQASAIAKLMADEEEARAPFTLRDLRRTIESELASLGVSRDHRAQLQSHGLGGVQDRHYDRYDYMKDKRRILLRWEQHLRSQSDTPLPRESNVRPLHGRATSGSSES